MLKLILKTLWTRRRRNGWLLAELILVSILSWVIFDPIVVMTHDERIPLGYDADRLCVVSLDMLHPQAPGYDAQATDSAALMDTYLHLMRRVRQHPDVALSTALLGYGWPNAGSNTTSDGRAEGDTTRAGRKMFMVVEFLPHTQYFETYGFRPGRGMSLAELSDYPYGMTDIVMPENSLELFFHTDDPRGKRLWDYNDTDTFYIPVVGSIGTVKYYANRLPTPLVFMPIHYVDVKGSIPSDARILVRLKDGVSMDRFLHDFKPWMLRNLRAGNLYARDLQSYEQLIDDYNANTSTPIYRRNLMMAVFFLLNLCLGVVGTFWLQTRTRREEVGVQLSFGATPRRLVGQLLGEGAVLTTLATLVGCFIYLQYALSEGLSSGINWGGQEHVGQYWTDSFGLHFLFVSLIVYAILLVVVSVGVYIPARKISRIPPTEALRDE